MKTYNDGFWDGLTLALSLSAIICSILSFFIK